MKNLLGVILAGTAILSSRVEAANGDQYAGYGVTAMGMGGASIANPVDATAAVNNPAGMGAIGSRVDGNVMVTVGQLRSNVHGANNNDDIFLLLPGFGANYQYSPDVTFGITAAGYGAGVDYGKPIPAFGTSNVKSALSQLILSPTTTYQFAPGHYLGFSVKLGYESLMLRGLENFGAANDTDHALGFGFGVGYLGIIEPNLRLGLNYTSPVWFQKMDAHEDIIPDGRLNAPQQAGAGLAYDWGNWTIAFDYVWLNWASQKTFNNSLTQGGVPGSSNGPGFGWQNQNVFRLGANYKVNRRLQLRTGVSLANHQVPNDEAMLIAICPCNQSKSVTTGLTYAISKNLEVSGSYMYDLRHITKGAGASAGADAGGELHMLAVGFGYKY